MVFCCYLEVVYRIYEIRLISIFALYVWAPVKDWTTRELVKLSMQLPFFLKPTLSPCLRGLPISVDYLRPFLYVRTLFITQFNVYLFLVISFSKFSILTFNLLFSSEAALSSLVNFSSFFSCLVILFFNLFNSFKLVTFSSFNTVFILLFLLVYVSSLILSLAMNLFYSIASFNLILVCYSSLNKLSFYYCILTKVTFSYLSILPFASSNDFSSLSILL